MELSIIVPVFNEIVALSSSLARLHSAFPTAQIVLVDDASTDGSASLVAELATQYGYQAVFHQTNCGKGAAIRAAIPLLTGTWVAIHDADLEYHPKDLLKLIQVLRQGSADVVYGNRFSQPDIRSKLNVHRLGNGLLTWLANVTCGTNLNDVETCYKIFNREWLLRVADDLQEDRFGIEIELTARLAKAGARFAELPIDYRGRSFAEGKKIGWRDGLSALRCIFLYGGLLRLTARSASTLGTAERETA